MQGACARRLRGEGGAAAAITLPEAGGGELRRAHAPQRGGEARREGAEGSDGSPEGRGVAAAWGRPLLELGRGTSAGGVLGPRVSTEKPRN